jgi:hypothetical protein
MFPHDNVPGLLTTQSKSISTHTLHHISVTDAHSNNLATRRPYGFIQAEVTHDGRNHCTLREAALLKHFGPENRQNLITINDPTLFVDQDASIRIPIQRQACIRARLKHRLGKRFRV